MMAGVCWAVGFLKTLNEAACLRSGIGLEFTTRPVSGSHLGLGLVKYFLNQLKKGNPDPGGGPFSLPEVRIAVIYVLIASIWIVGSDMVVNDSVGGSSRLVLLQSIKGLNFVVTTGVLLFFVLRRAYGGWRHSAERRSVGLKSARERYRNLPSRIQSLQEEERTRISREIHDELGQLFTGVKMQLRLIENRLSEREDRVLNPVIDEIVEAAGMIDETIASVKRISSGLRPPSLTLTRYAVRHGLVD
jgi:signal transduction histidine kinase